MTQPWVHDVLAPTGPGGGHEGRGLDALPYGVFTTASSDVRVGVLVGDHVLDLTAAAGLSAAAARVRARGSDP